MTTATSNTVDHCCRLRLMVCGAVQGVGFRPFVYRLANELSLTGWVGNSPQGVTIEIEGPRSALEQFRSRLSAEKPAPSSIQGCEASWLDEAGYDGFIIRDSHNTGRKTALVLPDIATCPDCLREMADPANRRYRYPFTNCTHCGPRFSIIEALPYDRANTSMRDFKMCPVCQAEYDNPRDRRFHAQPNACPLCGPQLQLWPANAVARDEPPRSLAERNDALLTATHAIRCAQIVAVKGIGGFHLMVDARNEAAVRRLRERKHREEKPFAVMCPTLESARSICEISPLEERLLQSPEAPIVLLKARSKLSPLIARAVAPGNPCLGVMLPSNPLHHLLMAELNFPVVATSGNRSDEPICTDEMEALERLRGIADLLLVHNRSIVRHVDDSIVRVMLEREMVIRRARGFAPLPVQLKSEGCKMQNTLAAGAHLKNAVALSVGEQVFVSQHIGDLETEQANNAFRRVVSDFQTLYDAAPDIVVTDLHPDYLSTRFATELVGPEKLEVQHHVAHVLSCMAENELEPPVLGVAWDGTGLGTDGTIWGGEFFTVTPAETRRVAHLRPFRLPGGDSAVKEPRRAALGLLHELSGVPTDFVLHMQTKVAHAFSTVEAQAIRTMLARGINAPWTSSVGRLFDGVAALVGLRQQMRFEGQAAMELEFALDGINTNAAYEMSLTDGTETNAHNIPLILDWCPMIHAILDDVTNGASVAEISAKFHNALAEAIVAVARTVGLRGVALSGGCFQNRYLTERTVKRLHEAGFRAYWHQRIPTNDGGIALGQIAAARRSAMISQSPQPAPSSLTCV